MRILLAHNRYQQSGGELQVFESEGRLLEERGHEVVRHMVDNRAIDRMSRPRVAAATVWNGRSFRELRGLLRSHRPEVVHFHNTFPLISPAAYYAASSEGIPVVQTLHNFRLLCANALLFREGRSCEKCLGRPVGWPGVVHRCYRDSRAASAVVVAMQATHRALRTWERKVDVYVALSRFAAGKFVTGGIPARKIEVKPNHIAPDPGRGDGRGDHVLFIGRLSPEKGIRTLLRAWREGADLPPLRIVGDGPLADEVREAEEVAPSVRWLGRRTNPETLDLLGRASLLVFPSECYENCPTVILEAFAKGTPVVAASGGTAEEIVEDGRTGAFFRAGDAGDLAATVRGLGQRPERIRRMREEARKAYLASYSADAAYAGLMRVYGRATAGNGRPHHVEG